jgi:hypothetical protein
MLGILGWADSVFLMSWMASGIGILGQRIFAVE